MMSKQLSTSIETSKRVDAVMLVLQRLLELGVSKSELARLLGVHRSSIYNWLRGKNKPVKVELWRIERIFDLLENRLSYDYYSLNHGGPPNNYFSYQSDNLTVKELKAILKSKRRDGSNRTRYELLSLKNKLASNKNESKLLKACLTKLTFYAGILGITYKVLLDDAALIIRSYLKENKVKRKYAGELALAALKIASARTLYKLDEERLQQILSDETIDQEKYKEFLASLAINYL